MSESYPHLETGLGLDEASAAELQRILAKVKRDQVQLVADQRALKQQEAELQRLRVEIEGKQQGLEAARREVEEARAEGLRQLEGARAEVSAQEAAVEEVKARLDRREEDLRAREEAAKEAGKLAQLRQVLAEQEVALRQRGGTADAREAQLAREGERLAAQRLELEALAEQLARERATLTEELEEARKLREKCSEEREKCSKEREKAVVEAKRAAAERESLAEARRGLEAEFEGKKASWELREAALSDQVTRLEGEAAKWRRECESIKKQLGESEKRVGESKKRAESEAAERVRRVENEVEGRARRAEGEAGEWAGVAEKRVAGLAAEIAVLREQKQRVTAERDALAKERAAIEVRCRVLETRVAELMAGGGRAAVSGRGEGGGGGLGAGSGSAAGGVVRGEGGRGVWDGQMAGDGQVGSGSAGEEGVSVVRGHGAGSEAGRVADALAAIAAHTVRRGRRVSGDEGRGRRGGWYVAGLAGAAIGVGVIVGAVVLGMYPARYAVGARVVMPAGSALADRRELVKAQRELAGRLVEAGLAGSGEVRVTAEVEKRGVSVRLVSTWTGRVREGLEAVLGQYRKDLAGEMLMTAQRQQDAEVARQIEDLEARRREVGARRGELEGKARDLAAGEKAYQDAVAAVAAARKELEGLRERSQKVEAGLRVLLRTPPASKIEATREQVELASSQDSQLLAVRGQVAARAGELREMLAGLVGQGLAKCDQMDGELGKVLEFLGAQGKQTGDEQLRGEIERIAGLVANLRAIVGESRGQIERLAGAIGRAREVEQAQELAGLHGESEKVLEALIERAAGTNKQIDALLEKIPAGGDDVTRRTVLQQRLRGQLAGARATYGQMVETLEGLRPSVNFRLDAALSRVAGLARELEERQRGLVEQIEQRESRRARAEYDRQVQEARAELEEYGGQRDRVQAVLLAANENMLAADKARGEALRVAGQIDDVEARGRELEAGLAGLRLKAEELRATATQPAIVVEGPVVEAAVNGGRRAWAASLAGLGGMVLVAAAGWGKRQRRTR